MVLPMGFCKSFIFQFFLTGEMCSALVVTPLRSIIRGHTKLKKLKDEGSQQPLVGVCQMYPFGRTSQISQCPGMTF